MDKLQRILLRRSFKVYVDPRKHCLGVEYLATFLKNLESIGFSLSPELIECIKTWSAEDLLTFSKSLFPALLKLVGGHVEYKPMYPNFPEQVMDLSEAELYLNALTHYYGDAVGLRIVPEYPLEERSHLTLKSDLKRLGLATKDEGKRLCLALLQTNTSLSNSDSADLETLLEIYRDELNELLPEKLPHKEVVALTCGVILNRTSQPTSLLLKYLRTPTDILRFATALSKGDVSLARSSRFVSFPRKTRKTLLALLDTCRNPTEEMWRHRVKWIRLAERLHPGEFHKRYPVAFSAITALRNKQKGDNPHFHSTVEGHFKRKEYDEVVRVLERRPGELARKLDYLLRSGANSMQVMDAFERVVAEVSTPVLLQILAHFKNRKLEQTPRVISDVAEDEQLNFFQQAIEQLRAPKKPVAASPPMRTVFPKGQESKLVCFPCKRKLVSPDLAERIEHVISAALMRRFAQLPALGNVYLDPALAKFTVPFSQRSASKALRTLSRGSKLSLPDAPTLRFFVWWKEGKVNGKETGRVDIDLSATFYGEDWGYKEHVSYTNLKSTKFGSVHSGDITSAPEGAAEFIDIDIARALRMGARYIVCSIYSFCSQPFCNLPECFSGWMNVEGNNSGMIFEPATVETKLDLASNSRICIPVVLDLKAKEVIWSDLALRDVANANINLESNERGLVHYGYAMSNLVRPNLYDLFQLHLRARGEQVDKKGDADIIFSLDEGITPYSFDQIISEYLA